MINTGYLAPIRIDNGSISARLIKTGSGATTQKIDLAFDWHLDVQDERLRTLEADEMTTDISLINGLLDVTSTYSAIGQTSFKATLKTQYGSFLNPILVEGLVAGDMALYNITDSANVAITTAVEAPDGTYTISYASQSAADVLRLTISKDGFDFTAVTANTITI
jgi:hypothetical protein